MIYYFWVKETEAHDEELAIIEADTLEEARKEFAEVHPEDVENIKSISREDEFLPVWQAEDEVKEYVVRWEVSKKARVQATSEEDAIEQVMSGNVDGREDEITTPPEAFEQ